MPFIIGFLVFPDIQLLDVTGPYDVLAAFADSALHLAWKDTSPVAASNGLRLFPTTTFASCPPVDMLCVPGGRGVNALMEDSEVLGFIGRQAGSARFITSVCTGALLLGAAGLLRGRRATTHWNALDLLAPFGALPTAGRVVRDGPLITAGGVTAGIDFALAIVAEIAGAAEAKTIQLGLEYAPEPPFDSGTPERAPAAVLTAARVRGEPSRRAREAIIARIAPL